MQDRERQSPKGLTCRAGVKIHVFSYPATSRLEGKRFIRETTTSGGFHASGVLHAKDRWHRNVIPAKITASFGILTSSGMTTSFGITTFLGIALSFRKNHNVIAAKRESSPSADRAIKVTPPGIVLLHPSCLPGSFPFLGTVSPCTVCTITFPGFPPFAGMSAPGSRRDLRGASPLSGDAHSR